MKSIPKTALVALMTATIGCTAIAPTFAQDAAAPAPVAHRDSFRQHHEGHRNGGQRGGGNVLGFEHGAEAVEIALVRLSYRLDLTAEQQPLFDTFKTEALSAASTFASVVEALRPTAPAEGEIPAAPDFAERLENSITIQTASLAALKAAQPSATAFFDSLTEEQLASLTPQRPGRDGGTPGFGKSGPRHQGGHHGGPGAPSAPGQAPAAPPANG